MEGYVAVLIFVVVGFAFAFGTFFISWLVHPHKPNPTKLSPYECGIEATTQPRDRYSIRYYIIAVLFVIFEVETIFLFPWAVKYQKLGLFGFVEMMVFIGILVVGYIYCWKKGALEWV